jgi:SnoaL-like domain
MGNEQNSGLAQEFMKRLQAAEEKMDARLVAPLFAPDAKMENLTRPMSSKAQTASAPEAFWSAYLSAFSHIHSHFTHVTISEKTAVLEWESEGSLAMGVPVHYCGVSILEFGDGAKFSAFRTYYDSAALIAHIPAKSHSATTSAPEITNEATS